MSDIEPTPIKVVPMFIDEPEPVEAPPAHRSKAPLGIGRIPGILAFGFALATAVLLVVAIVLATDADFETSTTLSWAAMIAPTVAVLGGIIAIVLKAGRGWGIAAVVVGILTNPYLLLQVPEPPRDRHHLSRLPPAAGGPIVRLNPWHRYPSCSTRPSGARSRDSTSSPTSPTTTT